MHEEVLEEVKEAMHLHERLNPYIQSLVENSHDNYEPIILPTFYAFEEDEKTYKDSDDFMLGDKLLVCPVVEEGQTERQIYLPKNPEGWVDYYTGDVYEGGRTITLDVSLANIPFFVKKGASLPMYNDELTEVETKTF